MQPLPERQPPALLTTLLNTLRPPFLLLTLVCVFLGAASVIGSNHTINTGRLFLVLLAALLAHISVNMLNEYSDFKTGLDYYTIKTPFNGGSGTLLKNPEKAETVFITGIISLLLSCLIGLYFIWQHGMALAPLGIIGLLLVFSYTPRLNRHPLLCLVAPGTGFGFVMVCGTQFVLQGEYSTLAWQAALVPFFLGNNLLLLNQYPDKRVDEKAGRYHFPIAYGIDNSNRVYFLFVVSGIGSIVYFVINNSFPPLALIALIPAPLAFYALYGGIRYGENIGSHLRYGAANVSTSLLIPLLLGLSFILD